MPHLKVIGEVEAMMKVTVPARECKFGHRVFAVLLQKKPQHGLACCVQFFILLSYFDLLVAFPTAACLLLSDGTSPWSFHKALHTPSDLSTPLVTFQHAY